MKCVRTAGLVLFVFIILGFALSAHAFNQPWAINMGITSFLDGGPDQPRHGLFLINMSSFVVRTSSWMKMDMR